MLGSFFVGNMWFNNWVFFVYYFLGGFYSVFGGYDVSRGLVTFLVGVDVVKIEYDDLLDLNSM